MAHGIQFSNETGMTFDSAVGYGRRKIIAQGSVGVANMTWYHEYQSTTPSWRGWASVSFPAQTRIPMVFIKPKAYNGSYVPYSNNSQGVSFSGVGMSGFYLFFIRLDSNGGQTGAGFDYIVYGDHSTALDNTGYGIQVRDANNVITFSSHDDALVIDKMVQIDRHLINTHVMPWSSPNWYFLLNALGPATYLIDPYYFETSIWPTNSNTFYTSIGGRDGPANMSGGYSGDVCQFIHCPTAKPYMIFNDYS